MHACTLVFTFTNTHARTQYIAKKAEQHEIYGALYLIHRVIHEV